MEDLLHYLSTYHPISESIKKALSQYIRQVKVEKGTYILDFKQRPQYVYFIQKGLARGIEYHKERNTTVWFWKEKDIMTALDAFLKQEPTTQAIEALEDCELLSLHYDDLQRLYLSHPEFNTIGRKIMEAYFLQAGEIVEPLRSGTAMERYRNFLAMHPNIFQRTTLLNISSYLGMTKETISRLRKQRM